MENNSNENHMLRAQPLESNDGTPRVEKVILPQKKKRKYKGVWIFLAILAGLLLMVGIMVVGTEEDEYGYAVNEPYIATVYVEGEIGEDYTDTFGNPIGYQHQWTLEQMDYLMEDANNEGLMLYVNSPGGGVYESDELYLKVKEYQKTTKRPVYAYMANYAASGGYYVLASADRIVANRNTITGSIGVKMGSVIDASALLQKYGIKVTEIASGNNKSMGSVAQPMTDEQKAILQSVVDESYEQFVGVIADGRGLSISQVKALADGRVYTAKQALQHGLVDEIGSYEQAMEEMKKTCKLTSCSEVDVTYETHSFLGGLLSNINMEGLLEPRGDVGQIWKIAQEQGNYPISYLCDIVK